MSKNRLGLFMIQRGGQSLDGQYRYEMGWCGKMLVVPWEVRLDLSTITYGCTYIPTKQICMYGYIDIYMSKFMTNTGILGIFVSSLTKILMV